MNTTGTGTTRQAKEATGTTPPATGNGDGTGTRADAGAGAGTGAGTSVETVAGTGEGRGAGGLVPRGAAAAWDLAEEPRAASRARTLTERTLRGWRVTDPGDIGDVALMVGELVTNAVVHGAGPVRLALRLDGRRLLAEVGDGDPALPPALLAAPTEPGVLDWSEEGRGLLLIAALAAEHGARPEADGKTVWFTRLLNPLGGDPFGGHRPASG